MEKIKIITFWKKETKKNQKQKQQPTDEDNVKHWVQLFLWITKKAMTVYFLSTAAAPGIEYGIW